MRRSIRSVLICMSMAMVAIPVTLADVAHRPHNIVLFVADGLRPGMVNADRAPAMAELLQDGVRFTNTHSLFPTFTTPNASAMATGHMLGDTGDYGNTIDAGYPVPGAGGSLTPFLESDPVLADVDEHFAGDYLNEETILAAARTAGFSTAAIGKLGPVRIFDHTDRSLATLIVDDGTGRPGGVGLSDATRHALEQAGLALQAPTRGENAHAGTSTEPGTTVANSAQQDWFADVAIKVALPSFKGRGKPFVLVFWSRDPDGTQHNQGDSLGRLMPGINGPTSRAAIRNADTDLARLRAALHDQGMEDDTDVILTRTTRSSHPTGFRCMATACWERTPITPTSSWPPMAVRIWSICRMPTRRLQRAWSPRCPRRITSAACSWTASWGRSPAHCRWTPSRSRAAR